MYYMFTLMKMSMLLLLSLCIHLHISFVKNINHVNIEYILYYNVYNDSLCFLVL